MNPTQPAQSTLSYWLPLITAILGFLFGGLSEWLRDRRAHRRELESQERTAVREREARDALRRDQLMERRNNFQRETLLELQIEMAKLMRATGEANHHDVMAHRAEGEWQRQLYPAELDTRIHVGMTKGTMLGVRIRDELVRELVTEMKSECARTVHCKSEQEAEHAINEASSYYVKLNDRIGELLRKLDDDAV